MIVSEGYLTRTWYVTCHKDLFHLLLYMTISSMTKKIDVREGYFPVISDDNSGN